MYVFLRPLKYDNGEQVITDNVRTMAACVQEIRDMINLPSVSASVFVMFIMIVD